MIGSDRCLDAMRFVIAKQICVDERHSCISYDSWLVRLTIAVAVCVAFWAISVVPTVAHVLLLQCKRLAIVLGLCRLLGWWFVN